MNIEKIYAQLQEDSSFFFTQTGLSVQYHEKYLGMLCEDTPIEDLKEAVLEEDYPHAYLLSHTLKGTALSLGLNHLGHSASQLCCRLRMKQWEAIQPALGEVLSAFAMVSHSVTGREEILLPKEEVSPTQTTILIVDDYEGNRSLLGNILKSEYAIQEATGGEEALALLHRSSSGIALVLLNVLMPRMTGFQVLEAMKQDSDLAPIPVILISADESSTSIEQGMAQGAVDYICRPFPAQRVRRSIKKYCPQRGQYSNAGISPTAIAP